MVYNNISNNISINTNKIFYHQYANLYEKKLSKEFSNNFGKMFWPVTNGFIINSFGLNNHFLLQNIQFYNPGIDIATYYNDYAQSIFYGVIYKIISYNKYDISIIIKHGIYFSIYSNIEKTLCIENELISPGQRIGTIKKYSHKIRIMKLIITKNSHLINPIRCFI